jgi:hypothetical protein
MNLAMLLGKRENPQALAAKVQRVLSSPGRLLDRESRTMFEPRFEHDVSHVRVDTGAAAAEAASSVNPAAFTLGSDIVFNQGQYEPSSSHGQLLIAHELAHTIQLANSELSSQAGAALTNKPNVTTVGP